MVCQFDNTTNLQRKYLYSYGLRKQKTIQFPSEESQKSIFDVQNKYLFFLIKYKNLINKVRQNDLWFWSWNSLSKYDIDSVSLEINKKLIEINNNNTQCYSKLSQYIIEMQNNDSKLADPERLYVGILECIKILVEFNLKISQNFIFLEIEKQCVDLCINEVENFNNCRLKIQTNISEFLQNYRNQIELFKIIIQTQFNRLWQKIIHLFYFRDYLSFLFDKCIDEFTKKLSKKSVNGSDSTVLKCDCSNAIDEYNNVVEFITELQDWNLDVIQWLKLSKSAFESDFRGSIVGYSDCFFLNEIVIEIDRVLDSTENQIKNFYKDFVNEMASEDSSCQKIIPFVHDMDSSKVFNDFQKFIKPSSSYLFKNTINLLLSFNGEFESGQSTVELNEKKLYVCVEMQKSIEDWIFLFNQMKKASNSMLWHPPYYYDLEYKRRPSASSKRIINDNRKHLFILLTEEIFDFSMLSSHDKLLRVSKFFLSSNESSQFYRSYDQSFTDRLLEQNFIEIMNSIKKNIGENDFTRKINVISNGMHGYRFIYSKIWLINFFVFDIMEKIIKVNSNRVTHTPINEDAKSNPMS